MKIEFDNNSPIYQQIVDMFMAKIISGELETGSKIKAVRDLANEIGVNPNTMQKALTILEQMKLVYTERTSGRFVTEDKDMVKQLKSEMLTKEIERFLSAMKAMGFERKEIIDEINKREDL